MKKKTIFLSSLFLSFALMLPLASAQTGDARRIEGQTAIDPEHHFRMALPAGWTLDPTPGPYHYDCFDFTRQSDPKVWGSISTFKRFHDETARQELDEWLVEFREDSISEGSHYESTPTVDTRMGGEAAVSAIQTFQDGEGFLRKGILIFAVKGEIIYKLSISTHADRFETLQQDIDFIRNNIQFEES
jgi:hypothetical protein